jgi:hypothetical protein
VGGDPRDPEVFPRRAIAAIIAMTEFALEFRDVS